LNLKVKKLIIDKNVAELYGVDTKEVNQAVSNNPEKFPKGYIFELTKVEKSEVVKNFDHLEAIKYSPYMPKAFSEKGLYMLATILKGKLATQTTITIIETFSKIRELSRTVNKLSTSEHKQKQKGLLERSGELFTELLDNETNSNEEETTIELNFVVLKFKHTIKKK